MTKHIKKCRWVTTGEYTEDCVRCEEVKKLIIGYERLSKTKEELKKEDNI